MKKLFTLTMICFVAASMQAKIYYVTADATTVATTSTISDWNNPVTLASTISIATTTTDSIWVKAGTYFVDRAVAANRAAILINSGVKQIFGGFAGTETKLGQRQRSDLDGNGIIEPWEFSSQTIFDGTNISDYTPTVTRVDIYTTKSAVSGTFYAPNKKTVISMEGSANHILDGVVVQNGKYDGDSYGSGINIAVAATVRNCIVRKCSITRFGDLSNTPSISDGAAIRVNTPLGVVDGCLIEDNTSGPLLPGGYNAGAGVSLSQGTVCNSVVRNNISYVRSATANGTSGFATGELAGLSLSAPTAVQNGNNRATGIYVSGGSGAGKKAPTVYNCIVANNEGVSIDPITATFYGVGVTIDNSGVIMNSTVVNNKQSYSNLNTSNTAPTTQLEGIGVYLKSGTYTSSGSGTSSILRNNIASIYNCIVLGNTAATAPLATKADISMKTNTAWALNDVAANVSTANANVLAPYCIMDVKNCIVGGTSINCDQLGTSATVVGNDFLASSAAVTFTTGQKTAVQTVTSNCVGSQSISILNSPSSVTGYSATDPTIKTANWRLKDGTFVTSGTVVSTSWINYSSTNVGTTYTYASPTTDLLGNTQGSTPIIGALFNTGNGTVTTINENIVSENATIHILGNEIKTDVIEPAITVYNTAGLRVKQINKTNNLSIADLHAGVYIVSAGNETLKFVK